MAMKKGPTKGSGGKHRNKLKGYGPTPKAEDRVYHKAYKAKKANERRQIADPRLAARRRVDKFASSDTSDLVYGRNSVLEALRVGVPSSTLYIMSRIEHKESTQNPTTKNNRIFYFPPCKDSPASCVPVQGQAPSGLAERKSSSLRCGIFFRQTLRVRPRDCQAGEK